MKRAVVVAGVIVGILAACRDQQSVTAARPGLSADFSDGRSTGGNPHFFFLPPLVSQPTFSGVFNSQIQPVVDICQLNAAARARSRSKEKCGSVAGLERTAR